MLSSKVSELSDLERRVLVDLVQRYGALVDRLEPERDVSEYAGRIVERLSAKKDMGSPAELRVALMLLVERGLLSIWSHVLPQNIWTKHVPITVTPMSVVAARCIEPDAGKAWVAEPTWIDVHLGREFEDGLLRSFWLESDSPAMNGVAEKTRLFVPLLLLLHRDRTWALTMVEAVLKGLEERGRVELHAAKTGKTGVSRKWLKKKAEELGQFVPAIRIEKAQDGRNTLELNHSSVRICFFSAGDEVPGEAVKRILNERFGLREVDPSSRLTASSFK